MEFIILTSVLVVCIALTGRHVLRAFSTGGGCSGCSEPGKCATTNTPSAPTVLVSMPTRRNPPPA